MFPANVCEMIDEGGHEGHGSVSVKVLAEYLQPSQKMMGNYLNYYMTQRWSHYKLVIEGTYEGGPDGSSPGGVRATRHSG